MSLFRFQGSAADAEVQKEILSHLPAQVVIPEPSSHNPHDCTQPARFHHLMAYESKLVADGYCTLDLQPATDARQSPSGICLACLTNYMDLQDLSRWLGEYGMSRFCNHKTISNIGGTCFGQW